MTMEKLLTSNEAAVMLRVSRRTVGQLQAAGKLRPIRIGEPGKRGRVFFTEEELQHYLDGLRGRTRRSPG